MDAETTTLNRRPVRAVFALLIAYVLLGLVLGGGCGGGGGGASSAALIYTTEWGSATASIAGESQRISIYTLDDRLVQTILLNRETTGAQQHRFSLSGSGTFRIVAELFSGANASGVRTGLIDTAVAVRGSTTFSSAVGVEPTSVSVTPNNVTIRIPESRRFFALAKVDDRAVFTAPNGFEWQTLGGTATVNSEGVVSAESAGQGSVRATHVDTGLSGSAVFSVQPFSAERRKWTVLVFMNAGNDLHPFSTLNVNQMEQVADNPDVRFVVQWKQSRQVWPTSTFDGTRRILVRPDNTPAIVSEVVQDMGTGVDMGRPETLRDFINWGKTYYPADRYVLVVWNHGNGWRRSAHGLPSRAVSYDDQFGSSIQAWELSQALGDHRFDIVAWDASLMQMIEVAYEVKDHADYVVGSQESPPGEGYPYHLVFAPFRNNPDLPTATLSKGFVDGMLAFYGNSRRITQSVLDTSKLGTLGTRVSALGNALAANRTVIPTEIQTVRNQAQAYGPTSVRFFRDLDHLSQLLLQLVTVPSVVQAAQDVRTAIQDAVVWNGNNVNSPNSRGVSVDFSPGSVFTIGQADYQQLRFAAETTWDEFLAVAP